MQCHNWSSSWRTFPISRRFFANFSRSFPKPLRILCWSVWWPRRHLFPPCRPAAQELPARTFACRWFRSPSSPNRLVSLDTVAEFYLFSPCWCTLVSRILVCICSCSSRPCLFPCWRCFFRGVAAWQRSRIGRCFLVGFWICWRLLRRCHRWMWWGNFYYYKNIDKILINPH